MLMDLPEPSCRRSCPGFRPISICPRAMTPQHQLRTCITLSQLRDDDACCRRHACDFEDGFIAPGYRPRFRRLAHRGRRAERGPGCECRMMKLFKAAPMPSMTMQEWRRTLKPTRRDGRDRKSTRLN